MIKKILIIVLIILALSSAGYSVYLYSNLQRLKATQKEAAETNEQNSNEIDDANKPNIVVFSPKKGDKVGLPIKILGEARVFENQFSVRIKDKNGNILAEEGVTALEGDAGEFNLFEKEINYKKPATTDGFLEVFDNSAKDGSEIDKVTIPIKFETVNSMDIKVFFGNEVKDPQTENCNRVYPVIRRIAYTKDTARTAIEELLKGITNDEREQGYFSSINQGVKLNNINIKDGIAKVDFDETLQSGVGGSCMVAAIRAQITETLKQFSTVQDVEISINGEKEEILQP